MSQAADPRFSICRPVAVPGSSGLAEQYPGAPSLQQPNMVVGASGQNVSPCLLDARCCGVPEMNTQRCVCVYGQREADGPDPSWPGSPYMYLRVRRNLVVGVEVVEEVAVEDTLEIITDDMYADDLLSPELLKNTAL